MYIIIISTLIIIATHAAMGFVLYNTIKIEREIRILEKDIKRLYGRIENNQRNTPDNILEYFFCDKHFDFVANFVAKFL